jgi:glycosyltransferase involved in cell wall biosynthesis
MKLSIVATVYNDEKNVPALVEEIVKHVSPLSLDFEVILVNDFSTDGSEKAIASECSKNSHIKGITLRRNFGQQIAMSAGIHYATGDYVVIMDGDLQNPPSAIPSLIDKIKQGNHDIVYCISKTRNDLWDSFTSAIFWSILTRLFGVRMVKNQLMMKIMTKDFAERIMDYGEINRTVDGIVNDISWNYSTIVVENQKRLHGKSHYNFMSRLNLMIDMVISLSSAPLNAMIYLGFFTSILTLMAFIYYLVLYLFFTVPSGYTSILLSVFFFGGLIIFILGIIGRYLANIYTEVRGRPLFHIKSKYNL